MFWFKFKLRRKGAASRRNLALKERKVLFCEPLESRRMLAAFTFGNVVALRVGDGTNPLDTSAARVFLDEYTPSGILVQSIAVPTSAAGGNRALTLTGSEALEGALSLSANGQFLTLAGYDAAPGTAGVAATASSSVNRVVGRVSADGTINTTTVMTDAYTGGTTPGVRSAATDDGSRFWVGGQGVSGLGGVRYVTLGNTGASTPLGMLPQNQPNNSRDVAIYGGQLYVSLKTGQVTRTGVATVGTGLPTTSNQPTILLPNLSGADNALAYALVDRSASVPGVDTLYVADQVSGLLKYSFDGTSWTARGSLSGSLVGLSAVVSGSSVELYATSGTAAGNSLVKVTDAAAFNATLGGSFSTLATAGSNRAFRGVAFAPALAGPVNVQPTLTAIPNPPPILEDASLQTINLAGISAGGTDSQTITITARSSNPALIPDPTVNYTSPSSTGTLTYAPVANANGSATITVTVQDNGGTANGGVDTLVRTFTVQVDPVNDAPQFTLSGNPAAVNEDAGQQNVPSFATNIRRGPAVATDEAGQSLTFDLQVVSTTSNLAFTTAPAIDSSTGALTYRAATNTNGTATVSVTLRDNGANAAPNSNTSAAQTFTITVNPVNDAPSFSLSTDPPPSDEDAGPQIVEVMAFNVAPGPASATDETGQALTFDVTVAGTSGGLAFSTPPAIDPVTGALTYTAAPNTSGTATINVFLRDSGSGAAPSSNISSTQSFRITVNPTNDAPTISTITGKATAEDTDAGPIDFTIDDIDTSVEDLIVTATSSDTSLVPDGQILIEGTGANRSLLITPTPNLTGETTITVFVTDGDATTSTSFVLHVEPVNDRPTFMTGSDVVVDENSGAHTFSPWATAISPGPGDEAGQDLSFVITNNTNPGLFSAPPTVDAQSGALSFTVAPDQTGTAVITIVLVDNGTGNNVSAPRNFTITVAPLAWHNSGLPCDVDGDGEISAIDLIYVVEALNAPGDTYLPSRVPPPAHNVDVNGDNHISGIDLVLMLEAVNTSEALRRQSQAQNPSSLMPSTEQSTADSVPATAQPAANAATPSPAASPVLASPTTSAPADSSPATAPAATSAATSVAPTASTTAYSSQIARAIATLFATSAKKKSVTDAEELL